MKSTLSVTFIAALLLLGCNIDKKEKGELPEVDVDVQAEAGELPEYDVNWADIEVSTRTRTVEVPKIVVVTEEEEVEVPYVDVEMPDETSEERTLMVEAEISDKEHTLEIQEIRASERRLYVISTLEEGEENLGDQTMRVQDQVDINAPDLNVKHIIVGNKADRVFNNQYTYVDNMNALSNDVQDAKVIYSR